MQCEYFLAGSEFVPQKCGPKNGVSSEEDGSFSVHVTGNKWPQDGMCSVLAQDTDAAYTISAELYNHDKYVGHPGIMYNAKDNDNFDFVYFR